MFHHQLNLCHRGYLFLLEHQLDQEHQQSQVNLNSKEEDVVQ